MPVINASQNLIEKFGFEAKEIANGIMHLGGEAKLENGEWFFEVGANRWDLFTPEGIMNALLLFYGRKKPEKYVCESSGIVIDVEESVKEVRPYVVGALVECSEINNEYIVHLMRIQEKFHETIGRKRKKLAIGIHDFDKVAPPFTYMGVAPETIAFEPLGFNEPMTLKEILEKHPKGIEYAWILEGSTRYPVIVDTNGEVLSFPPVINGNLTEVTEETRNLFIDMTGTDLKTLKFALNVLVHSLALHGWKVKTVEIKGAENLITPDFQWRKKKLQIKDVNSILGIELSIDACAALLTKMGYIVEPCEGALNVDVPPYRCDVMHNVDLVEDIAIAYGYDNITEKLPVHLTIGKMDRKTEIEDAIRKYFIGLGAQEVCSFFLSSEEAQYSLLGIQPDKNNVVKAKNAKTREYSVARHTLISNMLKVIYTNQRFPLPLKFFEIGAVFDNGECHKVCYASVHAKACFSEIKSVAESFLKEFEVDYQIESGDLPYIIPGRCGKIVKNNKVIGVFGEIHPQILENFCVNYPAVVLEFEIESLFL